MKVTQKPTFSLLLCVASMHLSMSPCKPIFNISGVQSNLIQLLNSSMLYFSSSGNNSSYVGESPLSTWHSFRWHPAAYWRLCSETVAVQTYLSMLLYLPLLYAAIFQASSSSLLLFHLFPFFFCIIPSLVLHEKVIMGTHLFSSWRECSKQI